jgi:hypothetical protein
MNILNIKDAVFRFYGRYVPIKVDLFLNNMWLKIKWKWHDYWKSGELTPATLA